jgi:hypothetical protein
LIEKAPGDVPARMRETTREPGLNGVAFQVNRHDRDCARCFACRPESRQANRKKHVDLSPDQIGRKRRIAFRFAASEPHFENYRLVLNIT